MQEIIEVKFYELMKLKYVIFICKYFDHVVNRGVWFSHEYEDILDNMTDEANEDEFDENDDLCSDHN